MKVTISVLSAVWQFLSKCTRRSWSELRNVYIAYRAVRLLQSHRLTSVTVEHINGAFVVSSPNVGSVRNFNVSHAIFSLLRSR